MYYHLFDGDWASNAWSWQWIARVNSSKKYFANQENINNYAGSINTIHSLKNRMKRLCKQMFQSNCWLLKKYYWKRIYQKARHCKLIKSCLPLSSIITTLTRFGIQKKQTTEFCWSNPVYLQIIPQVKNVLISCWLWEKTFPICSYMLERFNRFTNSIK